MSSSERIAAPRHPTASPRSSWLSIHEASALVGVSEATLRRWAEAGDVEAYVTPGGHRRFTRAALRKLMPRPVRQPRTLSQLGETPERIVQQYRRDLVAATSSGWLSELDETERQAFRESGRHVLTGVLAFLDAPSEEAGQASLADACAGAADYGRLAAARGLGPAAATEAFLRFRSPFLEELATIARRRRLEAAEAISLVVAAAGAFDRLLLALLEAQDAARC